MASRQKDTSMSIVLLLMLAAFTTAILSAIGKCPVWVPVLLVVLVMLLGLVPLR